MSARPEEKSSGTVLQEVKPMRTLAIQGMPRCAPVAFEAVLDSTIFVTLPKPLAHACCETLLRYKHVSVSNIIRSIYQSLYMV